MISRLSLDELWEEIRKFGLDYCDLPTMMSNVAALLRLLCVNIDGKYTQGISIFAYILTIVTALCFIYVFLFSMAWFVFWRCRITGEMVAAMVVLSLGISGNIGTVKLLYMSVYIDTVRKIGHDYLECDADTITGSRFHVNLLKSLRNVKKRAFIYWMVLVGNGVFYLVVPLIAPGKNLPENYYVIYGLEPMFVSPNFEIAYLIMTAGVYFICYVPASVSAYVIVVSGYTESQMRALSEEMLHLWPDAIKHAEIEKTSSVSIVNELDPKYKTMINKFLEKQLKSIIRSHGININLLRQVEVVFRGSIALGFVLLILSLLSELLGKLENTYLQMPFALMQVSMDCFAGQRIIDASMLFENAVYDCKWENFNKSNMKLVLIILMNAQKILTLSAGGITMLSFMSLMSVMKGIYSAYTALRSNVS